MSFEESQGIPSVNLNEFAKSVADKLMMWFVNSDTPIKLLELGYKDSEPKDIINPDLPTPAILIKFIGISPQNWTSRGVEITYRENHRMVVELMFKSFIILKAGRKFEGQEDQNLAIGLAIAVNTLSRFGHPVGQAQITEIEPQGYVDFSESEIDCKDSFIVWNVNWFHEAFIGDVYTAGFYDKLSDGTFDQFDPSNIREAYISFDSEKGKIQASVMETINENTGETKRVFRGINPQTSEEFTSNYVLIAEINEDE